MTKVAAHPFELQCKGSGIQLLFQFSFYYAAFADNKARMTLAGKIFQIIFFLLQNVFTRFYFWCDFYISL